MEKDIETKLNEIATDLKYFKESIENMPQSLKDKVDSGMAKASLQELLPHLIDIQRAHAIAMLVGAGYKIIPPSEESYSSLNIKS